MGQEFEADTLEEGCLLACSLTLSHTVQAHLFREGNTLSGLGLPTSLSNQDSPS